MELLDLSEKLRPLKDLFRQESLVQSDHLQNEDEDHDHANDVENAGHPSLLSQPAWKESHPAGPRLVTIMS